MILGIIKKKSFYIALVIFYRFGEFPNQLSCKGLIYFFYPVSAFLGPNRWLGRGSPWSPGGHPVSALHGPKSVVVVIQSVVLQSVVSQSVVPQSVVPKIVVPQSVVLLTKSIQNPDV